MIETKATYIGNGEFHNGIPARDLTAEDWKALTDEQRDTVRQSPCYRLAAEQAPKRAEAKAAPSLPAAADEAPKAG